MNLNLVLLKGSLPFLFFLACCVPIHVSSLWVRLTSTLEMIIYSTAWPTETTPQTQSETRHKEEHTHGILKGIKTKQNKTHIHTLASPPVPPLRHIYRWFVHRVRRRLVCRHKWRCRTDNTLDQYVSSIIKRTCPAVSWPHPQDQ